MTTFGQALRLIVLFMSLILLPLACERNREGEHETMDKLEEAGDEVKDKLEDAGDEIREAVQDSA